MLYRFTIKQFYSFLEKMNCIKLYCIYFKSMCFVTIPSRSSSIILSILGLLAVGWCSALLANSNNCIFTIFIQSEISNVIPNALLATIQSQSCFNNAKILQIRFASVTPIGPLEKMQSYSTCSTSSFSRSHLCWKSSWATSVPFVSCKEREQKRVKMYHF